MGAGLRAAAVAEAEARGYQIDLALMADPVARVAGEPRYAGHVRVRNLVVDRYLRPYHDAVIWVDADLIRYPADIVPALDQLRAGGIGAPFVYLDKWPAKHRWSREPAPRFYDTAGFVEVAEPAGHIPTDPPYFTQPGPVVELLSVGTIYMMPAEPFHRGHRYQLPPEWRVEHWGICEVVRGMGHPIRADSRIEAWHAYLPDYGEEWHTGHE